MSSYLIFEEKLLDLMGLTEKKRFLSDRLEPLFYLKEQEFVGEGQTFIEELEGIEYCYNKQQGQYMFSTASASVISNSSFSSVSLPDMKSRMRDVQYQIDIGRLLHTVFCYRLLMKNGLGMHAAVAVYKGEGIAFCGISGAGKSTQANLWKDVVGAWILNYDKPAVIFDEQSCVVYGTPWSGKEKCYINKQVPLKAIVFVEKAPINRAVQMSTAEAYSLLLLNNYIYPINDEITNLYEKQIEKLSLTVPVYRFFCTKDEEAVRELFCTLYDEEQYLKACQKGKRKMKISKNFLLRKIAGENIVIARGKAALDFQATIILNETSTFLWEKMQEEITDQQVIAALLAEYDVDEAVAEKDVLAFITMLKENGMLEEV